MGVFWNSAHQERPLTLVSLTHLHWLPGQNQFYPATRLQLARHAFATSDYLCWHKDFSEWEIEIEYTSNGRITAQQSQSLKIWKLHSSTNHKPRHSL